MRRITYDMAISRSSLSRAGLFPSLLGGYLGEAGAHWGFAEMSPGRDPLARLSTGLSEAGFGEAPSPSGSPKPAPRLSGDLPIRMRSGTYPQPTPSTEAWAPHARRAFPSRHTAPVERKARGFVARDGRGQPDVHCRTISRK